MDNAGRPSSKLSTAEIGWWIFMILACAQFTIRYVWRNIPFLDLPGYANGRIPMPYQGRVLMSWVLKATAANPHLSGHLARVGSHLPEALRNPYSVVLLGVDFVAMILCVLAGRATLLNLTGDRTFSSWASLLILYMSYFNLVVGYGVYMLPYDIVSLAIFVTSVWLIITRRYLALTCVVALGTLNRETVIFVPVFFCLYTWFSDHTQQVEEGNGSRWWTAVAPYLVVQVVVWVILRSWIQHHFVHNPLGGSMATRWFAFHLAGNLISLAKPPQWALLLSLFGFTIPLFVAKFELIGNRALAFSTAIVMALWTAAMLFVGVIIEIRIFNELTAFLMPCIALILWNQWIYPAARCRIQAADAR